MCLAIPARVIEVLDDDEATVDLEGVREAHHALSQAMRRSFPSK